jgi:16S rRNA (guanine527-N7)-methyltransferase
VGNRDLGHRIVRRASRVGVVVPADLLAALVSYLELLARWNRKINLTALAVDPPDDEAVDRLIVEPLVAARFVDPADGLVIDIGSGGGSPAVPFFLARPGLRLVMVESKVRKSAFLREVVRHLGLGDVEIANCRYEELLARRDLHEAADLVMFRAVRVDPKLLRATQAFLRREGRVFLFRRAGVASSVPDELRSMKTMRMEMLVPSVGSQLEIVIRAV